MDDYTKIIKRSSSRSNFCKNVFGYVNARVMIKIDKIIAEHNLNTNNFGRKRKWKIIKKECPICETKFDTLHGHPREQYTCGYSCANTHFRSGTDHPNWPYHRS